MGMKRVILSSVLVVGYLSGVDTAPTGLPGCTNACPVGLPNCGNTCWMNAALQCLFNMYDATDYLLKDSSRTGLLGAYKAVVAEMRVARVTQESLNRLKCAAYYTMQDAGAGEAKKRSHESLSAYIQRCRGGDSEDFGNQLDADEFIKELCSALRSPLLFNPQVLSFNQERSLRYNMEQAIPKNNLKQYLIYGAGALTRELVLAGEYVVIHDVPYVLTGVVAKSGDAAFGHYIAYVKRGDIWYECDDASINQKALLSRKEFTPYVLLYTLDSKKQLTNLAESLQALAQEVQ